MRASFIETLEELSHQHQDIFVLTADLGYKLFDNIKDKCLDRFYDIGVAEANMIGISAGLSLSGKNVFCYSIVPFLIMRAYEQIRIDIAYHNLNVKLVGVGGGFTYGLEGMTHFGLEDLTLMRSLPNMSIVIPADPFEAQRLAKIACDYEGPLYIRLGRTGEPYIHDKEPDIQIGKATVLNEGKDIAIFAIGNMVYVGSKIVSMLAKKGVNASLVNMHTLKPLDEDFIKQVSSRYDAIFTIEEHNVHGGLGSAIAEVLVENRYVGIFKRFGIKDETRNYIGNANYLREQVGLTPEKLYAAILEKLREI